MSRSLDIRLSSLVPPLAHTCDDIVHHALSHRELPREQWWRRVRLPLVLGQMGTDGLADGLARLTVDRWSGHCLAEVMPALYVTEEEHSLLALPVWQFIGSLDKDTAHEHLRTLFSSVLEKMPVEREEPVLLPTGTSRFWEGAPDEIASPDSQERSSSPGPDLPFVTEIDAWFSAGDERRRAVVARRLFTRTPETLEQLGADFGVSRERIRQIHKQAQEDLRTWLDSPYSQNTVAHLQWISSALGTAGPLDAFWEMSPAHRATVPSLGVVAGEAILALLPDHEVRGQWLVTASSDALAMKLTDRLREHSSIPLEEVTLALLEAGVPQEHVRDWLDGLPRSRVMGPHLVRWGRNLPDKAVAVLTLAQRPLHFDELVEGIGGDFNEAGFRERIHDDERIMRLDRRLFGLRSWGGKEYLGLEETMRQEITTAGGEMPISELIERITGWFDISESSIRTMGAGTAFSRPRSGWIALPGLTGTESAPYRPRRVVERTRRCFRDTGGTWWLRVDLNHDHLRGSGFPIPSGFAARCGMRPGDRRHVRIGDRDSVLVWKTQPLMSSIRPLLLAAGSREGDHAFITIAEGTVRLRARSAEELPLDPWGRALFLAGVDSSDGGRMDQAALSHAVGLSGETSLPTLLRHLEDRSDGDLIPLLASEHE